MFLSNFRNGLMESMLELELRLEVELPPGPCRRNKVTLYNGRVPRFGLRTPKNRACGAFHRTLLPMNRSTPNPSRTCKSKYHYQASVALTNWQVGIRFFTQKHR